MKENIKKIILESKSRRNASFNIFGYNNNYTLKKVDNYLIELNHTYKKEKKINFCKFCNNVIDSKNKFCNKSCAASYNNKNRKCTDETKKKTSLTLKNKNSKQKILRVCVNCNFEFLTNKHHGRKTCSNECLKIFRIKNAKNMDGSLGGKKSVLSQNRRSKNEVYLGELCKKYYTNVQFNEQMFNGWDADIILNNHKLAVMWNGNWHHKKITKKHSVLQVQNRDKIKIKEILKFGYEPYIINDYGKFNKKFVEKEFEKLKIFIKNKN